jgi:hypothetical protein
MGAHRRMSWNMTSEMKIRWSSRGYGMRGEIGDRKAWLWNVAFPRDLFSAACAIAGQPLTRQQ